MRNVSMLRNTLLIAGMSFSWLTALPAADDAANEKVRVTVDNFGRAETDTYFAKFVKDGAFGQFHHERNLASVDSQSVVRMNRDTLYSMAVFDLDASPVTITLPDSGKRFRAVQVINEDHYTPKVIYEAGPHTLTNAEIGTRYVVLLVRTFVNPADPADLQAVHALQDGIKVEQKEVGRFDVPNWDQESLTAIRNALKTLGTANGGLDSARMFGPKAKVDRVQHLIGTATGWGGNPKEDAYYFGTSPKNNDGKTDYQITVKDVPVDGFWSISVYNKEGFFVKNAQNAYTLNNVTAKPNADGSVTIRFGDCDGSAANCLPIMPGWNYLVRMYRPHKEILDGTWKFPDARIVK